MQDQPRREGAKFWRDREFLNLELLRATYITHTFCRHVHEGFAIGVIEAGAETFDYRGASHVAPARSLVVVNPGEVHNGASASTLGWTYRMLYPHVDLLRWAASEVTGGPHDIPFFPTPVVHDPHLARRLQHMHMTLEESPSILERETCLLQTLGHLIVRHADDHPVAQVAGHAHRAVRRVRDYLQACYGDNITLDQLAQVAQMSSFHLVRLFSKEMGLPPHAYLTQVRIERAKVLLSQGNAIADVASTTGFADQSHFTKRFKRVVGVPPSQYMREQSSGDRICKPKASTAVIF